MTKKVDKDQNFMKNEWGTQYLSSEYGWENRIHEQKMLREIANDDLTPKKHDFFHQNELHSKIRNDEESKNIPNLTFIEDKEYLRKGFYIDSRDSNPVKSSDFN